jgi:hypothetical protein
MGRGSKPARISQIAKSHRGRAEFFALPILGGGATGFAAFPSVLKSALPTPPARTAPQAGPLQDDSRLVSTPARYP